MMDIFTGFQFDYMRMVNSRLQVIHALGYPDGGTKAPQTYHFSGTYCSPDQKVRSTAEAARPWLSVAATQLGFNTCQTVLTSRVDTDGFLLGRFIHNFGNVTLRSSAQVRPLPRCNGNIVRVHSARSLFDLS